MVFERLPQGWEVWSDEATKVVLAYRPDVFDSSDLPAPCLPTLYLTKGERDRRPGRDRPSPEDDWHLTLYLEPEITHTDETFETRDAAAEGALSLASEFAAGEIDYRDLYQVPRPEYFETLDDVTGDDETGHGT